MPSRVDRCKSNCVHIRGLITKSLLGRLYQSHVNLTVIQIGSNIISYIKFLIFAFLECQVQTPKFVSMIRQQTRFQVWILIRMVLDYFVLHGIQNSDYTMLIRNVFYKVSSKIIGALFWNFHSEKTWKSFHLIQISNHMLLYLMQSLKMTIMLGLVV